MLHTCSTGTRTSGIVAVVAVAVAVAVVVAVVVVVVVVAAVVAVLVEAGAAGLVDNDFYTHQILRRFTQLLSSAATVNTFGRE